MEREYKMPRAVENELYAVYNAVECGENAENAVLDAASKLGYEVEDETEHHCRTEKGTWMHNVKLVKREPQANSVWLETVHVGWAHFNHPCAELAHRRGEWYMYFL